MVMQRVALVPGRRGRSGRCGVPVLAGGGGGGSAVYDGSTPLVVAGGGGGGGNYSSWGGNADQNGNGEIDGVDYAGQAGTLTGGPGAAGYFCCYTGIGYGVGMDGGEGAGGGGGGGGYWGGGGGSGLDGYPIYPVDFIFGGGGGASYPSAATVWDTTATPSVTITTASGFGIITTGQPSAKSGVAYGPVTLQAGNLGTSTSPYTTTVKWFGAELPKGLTLSSAGVLSGTPSTNLMPGTYSVVVQATETVTTLSGRTKVKTPTTVQAAIPLTITSTGPAEGDFTVATSSLSSATPGTAYGPVTLQAANLGTSTSPYTTTVKWFGAELPKGLTLSSAGVLSGTPSTNLMPGTYSVVVQATETVTTLSGRTKVKTPTTVQAAIPLTIT